MREQRFDPHRILLRRARKSTPANIHLLGIARGSPGELDTQWYDSQNWRQMSERHEQSRSTICSGCWWPDQLTKRMDKMTHRSSPPRISRRQPRILPTADGGGSKNCGRPAKTGLWDGILRFPWCRRFNARTHAGGDLRHPARRGHVVAPISSPSVQPRPGPRILHAYRDARYPTASSPCAATCPRHG